ncbi:hypothetical protein [Enterococcus pallens]|uniref:HK97 gp10 family phage protein n=1 Tax=Enterococcus pallens ATCC BAA-351 TaxID=1158607 RepID=R2SMK2_9ENTE|nr:hypothetical protein [Enterococcus pallens]EOH96385.1 hypothetical protein UAU_01036 [Enterococcus pallens ATCC BAA-351]EOU14402.1 hypothetical protein I588_04758 [Enterococcus pallens ATCC BAA-351]OJG77293.1 hypothetical protein RV10_GL002550 [Enterococcus pallens]
MGAEFNAATSWSVDFVELDKLIKNMQQIPDESETVINNTLKNTSGKRTVKTIIQGMPLSGVINRITTKRHAAQSQSLNITHENLGFIIRPKKNFEYLKYPDLGIGTSIKKSPQEFMRKGMEQEVPEITDDLNQELLKMINKKLGGK